MNKRKIALLAMSICMIAILAVGGSLAFLTDFDHQTNVFTTGNVEINLDETTVVEDPETDNLISDGKRTDKDQTYPTLHPNMTVAKDPTITVKSTEPCYVGAIVTVTGGTNGNLHELFGISETNVNLDIHKLVRGIENDVDCLIEDQEGAAYGKYGYAELDVFQNDSYAIYQVANKAENTWTFYIFVKDVKNAGDKIVLFEEMVISSAYDNDEMKILEDLSIEVKAYAVQADGFDVTSAEGDKTGCYNALTEAFEDWAFANNFKTQDGLTEDDVEVKTEVNSETQKIMTQA